MKKSQSLTRFALLLAFACSALRAEDHVSLRDTVKAYPVLEELKILCVKRAMPRVGKKGPNITMLKSLGFPPNHECQSSVRKMNYNNEFGILDVATGEYTTLYRPGESGRSLLRRHRSRTGFSSRQHGRT
jgi:hypothetical protein